MPLEKPQHNERSEQNWRRIMTPLFASLVLFGFYLLVKDLSPVDMKSSLEKVTAPFALSLIMANVLTILLVGWRLGTLVSAVAPGVEGHTITYINIVSTISAYAHIGKLNAPIKAILLKKLNGIAISRTTPVLLAESFFDLAALFIIALVGMALAGPFASSLLYNLGGQAENVVNTLIVASGIGIGILVAVWFFHERMPLLATMKDSIIQLSTDGLRLSKAAGFTVVIYGVNLLAVLIVLYFLNLRIDLALLLLLTALPVVAGIFTPLPGGLGVREFVFAAVYSACCGSASDAIVAALMLRLAFFAALPIAFVGLKLTEWSSGRGADR